MKKVWFELAVLNWVKKAAVTVNDTYLNRLVFCYIVGKLNKFELSSWLAVSLLFILYNL